MNPGDEVWTQVVTPLENLRADAEQNPGTPWQTRRDTLYPELTSVVDGAVADRLVSWLDGLPEDERTALLVSDDLRTQAHQVVSSVLPAQTADTGAAVEYDNDAWFAFLAENGVRWDGTEESWSGFRDWFLYYATEGGFAIPAGLLFDYLEPRSAAERVTLFSEYGVTIAVPEHLTAAALDPASQRLMANLLAENPEFAEIPEARRVELLLTLDQGEQLT